MSSRGKKSNLSPSDEEGYLAILEFAIAKESLSRLKSIDIIVSSSYKQAMRVARSENAFKNRKTRKNHDRQKINKSVYAELLDMYHVTMMIHEEKIKKYQRLLKTPELAEIFSEKIRSRMDVGEKEKDKFRKILTIVDEMASELDDQ